MPRYAAIDIGSNSIRMAAAEVLPGSGMRVLASERVVTRLGESVFRNGLLAQEPLELTCTVLARMAQQYQKLDCRGSARGGHQRSTSAPNCLTDELTLAYSTPRDNEPEGQERKTDHAGQGH
jgi:exopolyphosphatase/guanosine-5'-triphosphate,3'-diphosphate pyrophosphatase